MEKVDSSKDIKEIGEFILLQAQKIIKLNGAYKSGRLLNSLKIKTKETELGLEINITTNVPYAKYIDMGTYQWKNQQQVKEPVIRKYEAIPSSNAYPFNKEGIEPIHFTDTTNFKLQELIPVIQEMYSKKVASIILQDFK